MLNSATVFFQNNAYENFVMGKIFKHIIIKRQTPTI